MLYRTKSVIIEATKMTAQISLTAQKGGEAGDWLIMGVDGKLSVLPEQEFFEKFEPVDDETAQPTRFAKEKTPKERKPRAAKKGLGHSPLAEGEERA